MRKSDDSVGADIPKPKWWDQTWDETWDSWSRRHPLIAPALAWANERGAPWFALAGGLVLAFALPPSRILFGLPAGSNQLWGLVFIAIGSLALGLRLFVATVPRGSGFTRPVGQMLIATLVNWLFAGGLGWCGVTLVERLGAQYPAADLWNHTTAIPAALWMTQAILLPVYAWWRWFGDRDMDRMLDGIAKRMREDAATENAAQLRRQADQIRQQQDELQRLAELRHREEERHRLDALDDAAPPEDDPEPEAPSGPHLMSD